MTHKYPQFALSLLIFASVVFSMACSGTTSSNTAVPPDVDCSKGTPEQRKKGIEDKIAYDLTKSEYSELAKQIAANKASYRLGTVQYSRREIIYVKSWGALDWKKDKDSKVSTMESLLDVLDDYMKAGCVEKVVFAPSGAPEGYSAGEGFEWTLCEAPKNPCSDGTCSSSCYKAAPGTEPGPAGSDVNSNAGPGAKPYSNSNSGSNAGANKDPNAKPPDD